jgi:hypothetical protein
MNSYNRVLIPLGNIPMRGFETKSGRKGAVRDGSFIPYIVEELVSRSAYQVVFDYHPQSFINSVPASLKGRVDWVDTRESRKRARDYLSPLFDELFVDSDGSGYWIKKDNLDAEDHENLHMLMNIAGSLEKFFLAIEENLQVDIDLASLKNSLLQARNIIRSSEGRARISVLQGLIGSYKILQSPCLIAVPTASEQIVEHFQRLTNDAYYIELSKNAMQLGYVEKTKRAIELMRRGVGDLLKNSYFSGYFNQGAKAISLATQIHVPETDVAESFLSRGYLPPIVSLLEPLSTALVHWERHSPPLIHANPMFEEEILRTSNAIEIFEELGRGKKSK